MSATSYSSITEQQAYTYTEYTLILAKENTNACSVNFVLSEVMRAGHY